MDKKKTTLIVLIATAIVILLFGGITLGNAAKKSANNKTENSNTSEQVNSNKNSTETETDAIINDANTQNSENTTLSTETNMDVTDADSENVTSSENDTSTSKKEEVNNKPENSETNTEKEESSNDNSPSVPDTPSAPAPETPSTPQGDTNQDASTTETAHATAVYSGNEIGDGLDSAREGLHQWTPDGKYELYVLTTLNGYSGYWFCNNDMVYLGDGTWDTEEYYKLDRFSFFQDTFEDKYLTNENKLSLSKGSSQYHEYPEYQFMAYYDYDTNGDMIYGHYYIDREEYWDEKLNSWVRPTDFYYKDINGNWYIIDENGNRVYD